MKHYYHIGKTRSASIFAFIITGVMVIISVYNSWYLLTIIVVFFMSGAAMGIIFPRNWGIYADSSVIVWSNTRKLHFVRNDDLASIDINDGDPGSVTLKYKDGTSRCIPNDCCGDLKIFGESLHKLNVPMKIYMN